MMGHFEETFIYKYAIIACAPKDQSVCGKDMFW